MRVLVVSNLKPDAGAPHRGSFVRDQAAELRHAGLDVEVLELPPGWRRYPASVRAIRRVLHDDAFDVVHAHYGLTGWFAKLAGARRLVVTFHGTDVRHPVTGLLSRRLLGRIDLVAVASRELFQPAGGRPGLPREAGRAAVLPCGAELERFERVPQARAREALGLDRDGRYLLFPADPARAVKRHDRAAEVARLADAQLLTGGRIDPDEMVLWVNAASAVLVTSDNEGFGLPVIEALACERPVLSTPVGVAPALLSGLEGCLAGPFDARAWAGLARAHVEAGDPRVEGQARARWFSARAMADRVVAAYAELDGVGPVDLS